ncbi:MAG: proprotein convertase P-domain-containing protein [Xanthomonadales bacterium]|nr:proprotein convertase P-domain-containing protein [Xanthomonadales bacterium]
MGSGHGRFGGWAAVAVLGLVISLGARAANPTNCSGGNYDPPNNGSSTNFACSVSGNSGAINGMTLTSDVRHSFAPCINEHTFRLFSPLGSEHLVGTRNGVQTTATINTFNGQSSNGTWTLRVTDSNGNDACNDTVNSWRLNFTLAGTPNPTVSFADATLGENLGPVLRVQVTTEGGVPTTGSRSVDVLLDVDDSGSATTNSDYTLVPGTLNIPAGTASGQMFVVGQVQDDAALERAETIRLKFANPNGVVASASTHTITLNDDETGVISFDSPGSTLQEATSLLHPFPISLLPSSSDGVASIGLSLSGTIARISGSATQGAYNVSCPNQDWSFLQNPITFEPSDAFWLSVTLPTDLPVIRVCNDGAGDPNETIVFQASVSGLPANVTIFGTHAVVISEVELFRHSFE